MGADASIHYESLSASAIPDALWVHQAYVDSTLTSWVRVFLPRRTYRH